MGHGGPGAFGPELHWIPARHLQSPPRTERRPWGRFTEPNWTKIWTDTALQPWRWAPQPSRDVLADSRRRPRLGSDFCRERSRTCATPA